MGLPASELALEGDHDEIVHLDHIDQVGDRRADLEQRFEPISEIPDPISWRVMRPSSVGWPRTRGTRADIVGCAGAIAWLIASTGIPAAKILRIKKLIDRLGGVAKAVQLFWRASFEWEKIQALGGAAAALGAELLGIAAVKQKCFS